MPAEVHCEIWLLDIFLNRNSKLTSCSVHIPVQLGKQTPIFLSSRICSSTQASSWQSNPPPTPRLGFYLEYESSCWIGQFTDAAGDGVSRQHGWGCWGCWSRKQRKLLSCTAEKTELPLKFYFHKNNQKIKTG